MTLLRRHPGIFGEILLDEREKSLELRRSAARTANVIRRGGVVTNLLDGSKIQIETFCRFTKGDLFDEKSVTDFGPKLHVFEHRVGIVAIVRILGIGKKKLPEKIPYKTTDRGKPALHVSTSEADSSARCTFQLPFTVAFGPSPFTFEKPIL